MIAGPQPWDRIVCVVILLVLWVGMALHTSLAMRRYGRRWWVWFLISVFCSVIPAAVVSHLDYLRQLRRARQEQAADRGATQCPHCRMVLRRSEMIGAEEGPPHCPRCNGIIDDRHLA